MDQTNPISFKHPEVDALNKLARSQPTLVFDKCVFYLMDVIHGELLA
jgi:hypothetical protein